MATIADVTTEPSTGLRHIDALLDDGPGWNWLTPARNVLYYTFATDGIDPAAAALLTGGASVANASQQSSVSAALAYIGQLTGISFQPTGDSRNADLHFSAGNITNTSFAGYCYWTWNYGATGDTVTRYSADAYIFLDNAEYRDSTINPVAGSFGYELILHEIGHALGLSHSFSGNVTLPPAEENTAYTLMSYTDVGGPYSSYRPYDVAALMWLYGGDGLGGALGQGAPGRYLIGTAAADTLVGGHGGDVLEGGGGSDSLNGGPGIDTAVFPRTRDQYTVTGQGTQVSARNGAEGSDLLSQVERLRFADVSLAFDLAGHAGTTARFLGAVFGPAAVANAAYAGIGLDLLDSGMDSTALMQLALNERLGAGYSGAQAVDLLFRNLTGQAPGAADMAHWGGTLSSGQYTPVTLALMAAALDLNAQNIGLVGLAETGLAFSG